MSSFQQDFDKARGFYLANRGEIESLFRSSSQLFNIEFDDSDVASLIDRYCGIDYLLKSNGKVYGVAARINFKRSHHGHVTIRYQRTNGAKTEFIKRCESIMNDQSEIYASITMQIDAKDNEMLRLIVFESDKLYMEIFNNLQYYETHFMRVNAFDGNTFFRLSYDDVRNIAARAGFRVMVRERQKESPLEATNQSQRALPLT